MPQNTDFTQKDKYTLGFESPDASSYAHIANENVEVEVEPSQINLKSFKKHDGLDNKIWNENGDLDLRVRSLLLDISDDFWETCKIRWVKPKKVILVGSICNYNWSKYSDIDVHLIVDFKEVHDRADFVREYFNEKKNEWNENHKGLKIFGFPVELYVQDVDDNPKSGGIYDLYENKWLRKPKMGDLKPIKLDKYYIKDLSADIMTKIDDLCDAFEVEEDKHHIEEIGELCDKILDSISSMRKRSLEKGEMAAGNICYKVLRRSGYLDKIWDLKTKIYDKLNSLSENLDFNNAITRRF